MVGLSVRTLFDLFLAAVDWQPGDRIVFTGVTIADMPRIARARGFEVATVDVDPVTTEPELDALAGLIDDRTRALVFTHLFGARLPLDDVLALTRARGVALLEDCAEAYAGPGWRGHPDADASFFSFGAIKTATAFGGGLVRVRDAEQLDRMRAIEREYPAQPRLEYLRRCFVYGFLGFAGIPTVSWVVKQAAAAVGTSINEVAHRLTRAFPGNEFFGRIRRRPSVPLVRFLRRRLEQGDAPWERRLGPGEVLMDALEGLAVPTRHVRPHGFWVIPVLCEDPEAMAAWLLERGFNAAPGRALAAVENDEGVAGPPPEASRAIVRGGLYLPFSPQMPATALEELGRLVRARLSSPANGPI